MDKNVMLVVDDKELNRYLLSNIFREQYMIVEAANGKEAVDYIGEHNESIVIILLDILMPVMDGFGVLEFLKESKFSDKIPVVLITADDSIQTEHRGYEYGVADVIKKPFVPSIVTRRVKNIIELYASKRELEKIVREQMEMLEAQYYEVQLKNQQLQEETELLMDALSNVVEFRDSESGDHIIRIKEFTRIIALYIKDNYPEYGLTYDEINLITKASVLHDVGKIAISDAILLKPGKLTVEEFEKMKKHTTIGCSILNRFKFIKDGNLLKYCHDICLGHHERWSGKGYPSGLVAEQTPISAQIVAIADVYDALVSKRVYKSAYSHKESFEMIKNGECGEFNPKVMHCFELAQEEFEKILDSRNTVLQF